MTDSETMACLSMRDRFSKSHLPIPDFVFPGYRVRHRGSHMRQSIEDFLAEMEEEMVEEGEEKPPVRQVREEHPGFTIYRDADGEEPTTEEPQNQEVAEDDAKRDDEKRSEIVPEPEPFEADEGLPMVLSEHLRPYQVESIKAVMKAEAGKILVVIPTAGGKSLILSELARIFSRDGSVFIITHRKELVSQNSAEIEDVLGLTPGIWSAGLKRKTVSKITVGGIQSMINMPYEIIPSDLGAVIVDEAHRVRDREDSQYAKLLKRIEQRCGEAPTLIGLTATPFHGDTRLSLVDAGVFEKVVYEVGIMSLIEDGYLSPIKAFSGKIVIDEKNLDRKPGGGDFTESSQEREIEGSVEPIADDVVSRLKDRKKWILFLPGVASCYWFHHALTERGISSAVVVGTTKNREEILDEFRRPDSKYRALVSCNVLSEGFNVPDIDAIAMIRATSSPTLYVQAVGRGTRIAAGKENCLLLDYGENVLRHGSLDNLKLNKPKEEDGEAPMKRCQPDESDVEGCGALVPTGCRYCPECGEEFPKRRAKVFNGDGREIDILSRYGLEGYPNARLLTVTKVSVRMHVSRAGNEMIRIQYSTTTGIEDEYLFVSRTRHGFKGHRWFGFIEQVCPTLNPKDLFGITIQEVASIIRSNRRPILYVWSQPQRSNPDFTEVLARVCEGDPLPEEA